MNSTECIRDSHVSIVVTIVSFLLGYFFFFLISSGIQMNRTNKIRILNIDDIEK